MNQPSQSRKYISILMIFVLLMETSGCYSKRILPASEINESDNYLIHDKELIYTAINTNISNGIFSGNLDFNNKDFTDPRYFHIYLLSDSLLTINNDNISFPVNSIKEIRQRIHDPGKTKILVVSAMIIAGSAVATLGIIAAADLFKVFEDAFYCNERYP